MNRDNEFRRALAVLWLRGAPIDRLAKLDARFDDMNSEYNEHELEEELRDVVVLKPRRANKK